MLLRRVHDTKEPSSAEALPPGSLGCPLRACLEDCQHHRRLADVLEKLGKLRSTEGGIPHSPSWPRQTWKQLETTLWITMVCFGHNSQEAIPHPQHGLLVGFQTIHLEAPHHQPLMKCTQRSRAWPHLYRFEQPLVQATRSWGRATPAGVLWDAGKWSAKLWYLLLSKFITAQSPNTEKYGFNFVISAS